jgi:hypothetical protein
MKMVSYRDYTAGWLDSSIESFLSDLPATYDRLKFCLLTCIDSNTNPGSLLDRSPELAPLKPEARVVGQGLLVPTRRLLEADRARRIFFGFDEIWFFPGDAIEPKPGSAWLVGPSIVEGETFEALGDWLVRNSCSLGLGDGNGMNLVVKARGLVGNLIGQSLKQVADQVRSKPDV